MVFCFCVVIYVHEKILTIVCNRFILKIVARPSLFRILLYNEGFKMTKGLVFPSTAYLRLCECRQHGCIVTADQKRSPEFCSKETGLRFVEEGVQLGYIPSDELPVVRQQVHDSSLPHHDDDAPLAGIVQMALVNIACEEMEKLAHASPSGDEWGAEGKTRQTIH